ncbi:cytochrome c oxidase subunit IV-domain-containing protein [Lipomyces kononenkoae]|uniref:Cytochrome c oxidase subunit IV-domain-containing protein n=1 Tax=Lipomyces kononenkoae TaxID=34357 RepID=A0ACC3T3L6_LIPKO
MLRASIIRAPGSVMPAVYRPTAVCVRHNTTAAAADVSETAVERSIATPLIADLPQRWETIPVSQQVKLTTLIWERQKKPWTELSELEKRASYYISYGPWGPRKPMHEDGDNYKIIGYTILGCAAAVGIFAVARVFGGNTPLTVSREYEESRKVWDKYAESLQDLPREIDDKYHRPPLSEVIAGNK